MIQTADLTAYKAFTTGIKKAYLVNELRERDEYSYLAGKYPGAKIDDERCIFFQTGELRDEFMSRFDGIEPDSPEYHRLLGQTFGYPPQAIEFFIQRMEDPTLDKKRAGFHYAGLNFVGNVEQSLEICYWLWKNVRVPMGPVEVNHLRVKYIISPEKI